MADRVPAAPEPGSSGTERRGLRKRKEVWRPGVAEAARGQAGDDDVVRNSRWYGCRLGGKQSDRRTARRADITTCSGMLVILRVFRRRRHVLVSRRVLAIRRRMRHRLGMRHLRDRCEQHHHGRKCGEHAAKRRRQADHQATILWRTDSDIKASCGAWPWTRLARPAQQRRRMRSQPGPRPAASLR